MKIVVCIKQVPDSAAKVSVEGGRITWGEAELIINPWDEYAIEAAIQQKEAAGGDVVVVSMGSDSAKKALVMALAMGATEAVLISDPALANADSQTTARVLAGAIKKIGGVEMAFFGKQAIDGDMGVTAYQVARVLGWPALAMVASVQQAGGGLRVERSVEEGRQTVESKLPAVLSVSKDIGEPRYPSFMGIRKAQKAPIPTWSLADLGLPAPKTVIRWPEILEPPAQQVLTEIVTGGSAQEIADKLADKILAEKVL